MGLRTVALLSLLLEATGYVVLISWLYFCNPLEMVGGYYYGVQNVIRRTIDVTN